jgi:hypothetical protein
MPSLGLCPFPVLHPTLLLGVNPTISAGSEDPAAKYLSSLLPWAQVRNEVHPDI